MKKNEYWPITGVEDAFIAIGIFDTAENYYAGVPERTTPMNEANWTSSQESTAFYGFNVKQGQVYGTEENSILIRLTGVSERTDALWRGKAVIGGTGVVGGSGNTQPPEIALGLKINKGNEYVYVWFLKGTLSGGSIVANTKENGVTINMREYTFSAVESMKKFTFFDEVQQKEITTGITWVKGDTNDQDFSEADWFSKVQTPDTLLGNQAELEVLITPTEGATAVAVDSEIVITSNNTIAQHSFALYNADSEKVAVDVLLSDDTKTITIKPTSELSSGEEYTIAITSLKDVYGQEYSSLTKFTTA